jgi:hypothetical protein
MSYEGEKAMTPKTYTIYGENHFYEEGLSAKDAISFIVGTGLSSESILYIEHCPDGTLELFRQYHYDYLSPEDEYKTRYDEREGCEVSIWEPIILATGRTYEELIENCPKDIPIIPEFTEEGRRKILGCKIDAAVDRLDFGMEYIQDLAAEIKSIPIPSWLERQKRRWATLSPNKNSAMRSAYHRIFRQNTPTN